jgi:hypothetical protein
LPPPSATALALHLAVSQRPHLSSVRPHERNPTSANPHASKLTQEPASGRAPLRSVTHVTSATPLTNTARRPELSRRVGVSPRLQSLPPVEQPYSPSARLTPKEADALLTFSPPRPTSTAVGLSPSPHELAVPRARPFRHRPSQHRATLQGLNPTAPEGNSEKPPQPP